MGNPQNRRIAIIALAATMLLGAHTTATAVECKGMEKQVCEQNIAQCSWVEPYTRKDGVAVSGHCRKKPGKKSSSADS